MPRSGPLLMERLRVQLPWILRGSVLLGAGALAGLGIGTLAGMPGLFRGPSAPARAAAAEAARPPGSQARAPQPAPPAPKEPAPAQDADADAGAGAGDGRDAAAEPAISDNPAAGRLPGTGTEVIQVAATPFRPLADAVRKRLEDVGYRSYVGTVVLEGRQRFRVRVEPGADRSVAQVAAELRKLGYPVWVTRE